MYLEDSTQKPDLSVIVPTHGRPNDIRRLITSLVAQDIGPRAEFLIVANLEDQELKEEITRLNDSRFRLFVSGRLGCNAARNIGLTKARGQIAYLLDDDCVLRSSDSLSQMIRLHEEFPQAIAIGGWYQNSSKAKKISSTYNAICNEWIESDQGGPRETTRLLGGCVSYKLQTLRDLKLKFDESIVYGGTESEFHYRLSRYGLKMIFHPEVSVIHACDFKQLDLCHKAFRQGHAKARYLDSYAELESKNTNYSRKENKFLKAYRLSFSLGERRAYEGKPAAPNSSDKLRMFLFTFALMQKFLLFLSLLINGVRYQMLPAAYNLGISSYWVLVRLRNFSKGYLSKSYWFLYRHVIRMGYFVRGQAIKLFWFCYGPLMRVGGNVTGQSKRAYLIAYWKGYGPCVRCRDYIRCRLTQLYWFTYKYLTQSYYAVSGGALVLYWSSRRKFDQSRAFAIRSYWTFYPVIHYLKKNWSRPQKIGSVKMPMTYPGLQTTGDILWTIKDDYSPRVLERVQKLGVTKVETTLAQMYASTGPRICILRSGEYPVPGAAVDFRASVPISDINSDANTTLMWLNSLPVGTPLHFVIDEKPSIKMLRRFVQSLVETLKPVEFTHEICVPRNETACDGFEYFKWIYRFSAALETFGLNWRAYYRYECNEDALFEQRGIVSSRNISAEQIAPKISVIIPHHCDNANVMQVLRQLESQTLRRENFEVVLVDNAVGGLLLNANEREQMLLLNLNLKILTLESRHRDYYLAGHARNQGLAIATGAKILFLDSDILLPDDFLQSLIDELDHSDVIMAKRFMLNKKFVGGEASITHLTSADFYREDDYWEGFRNAKAWSDLEDYWKYSCTYCFATHRRHLEKSGPLEPGFRTYGFEDVDLGFRLFKMGLKFSFALLPVYHLYAEKSGHNYHWDNEKRQKALKISALTFFLARPERLPFILCQGYFAPYLWEWVINLFKPLFVWQGKPVEKASTI